MKKALVIAAVVCFALAAFGIAQFHWVTIVPLGLALYVGSKLL